MVLPVTDTGLCRRRPGPWQPQRKGQAWGDQDKSHHYGGPSPRPAQAGLAQGAAGGIAFPILRTEQGGQRGQRARDRTVRSEQGTLHRQPWGEGLRLQMQPSETVDEEDPPEAGILGPSRPSAGSKGRAGPATHSEQGRLRADSRCPRGPAQPRSARCTRQQCSGYGQGDCQRAFRAPVGRLRGQRGGPPGGFVAGVLVQGWVYPTAGLRRGG